MLIRNKYYKIRTKIITCRLTIAIESACQRSIISYCCRGNIEHEKLTVIFKNDFKLAD